MIKDRIHFNYQENGVNLDFGFDVGPMLLPQLKIFRELLDQATKDIVQKIQSLEEEP